MDRRHFFRLIIGVPSVAILRNELKSESPPQPEKNPLHECVDRPNCRVPRVRKQKQMRSVPGPASLTSIRNLGFLCELRG